jgi:ABC-2 type transport system ATP-binding protein
VSVIRTDKLSRHFGDVVALRELDLEIAGPGVIGLVGPNGSGKSTLIRLLLGLIRPSSGGATVFDSPISHPGKYAHRVGALIESPAFAPALSAQANLRSLARLRGISNTRVDEVLATVGLLDRSKEPVKRFSLGMKQRLGIAAALLPDAELLVLDEPTNGLDPAGIVEMRQLLRSLGDQGRTVIVSSHLLSEIEAACDSLASFRVPSMTWSPRQERASRSRRNIRPTSTASRRSCGPGAGRHRWCWTRSMFRPRSPGRPTSTGPQPKPGSSCAYSGRAKPAWRKCSCR